MSLELLFQIANAAVVPFWLLLAFLPRWIWTVRVVQRPWAFLILGACYGLLIALSGPGPEGAGMDSLDGVSRMFQNPRILLAGWMHYLIFDLFVGAWITRDAVEQKIPQLLLVPVLFLTLMFGPLGLATYLVLRWMMRRKLEL